MDFSDSEVEIPGSQTLALTWRKNERTNSTQNLRHCSNHSSPLAGEDEGEGESIFPSRRHPCGPINGYSFLREVAGLAWAAFNPWRLTVPMAMTRAPREAAANTNQPRSIR